MAIIPVGPLEIVAVKVTEPPYATGLWELVTVRTGVVLPDVS
jgi:hypothetical protein